MANPPFFSHFFFRIIVGQTDNGKGKKKGNINSVRLGMKRKSATASSFLRSSRLGNLSCVVRAAADAACKKRQTPCNYATGEIKEVRFSFFLFIYYLLLRGAAGVPNPIFFPSSVSSVACFFFFSQRTRRQPALCGTSMCPSLLNRNEKKARRGWQTKKRKHCKL